MSLGSYFKDAQIIVMQYLHEFAVFIDYCRDFFFRQPRVLPKRDAILNLLLVRSISSPVQFSLVYSLIWIILQDVTTLQQ
jgi:hypothetical protein